MKIFITGGTGFLGKYVTSMLLERGHELYILSRKSLADYQGQHYIEGDLSSLDVLKNGQDLQKISDCELIIHLGAFYKINANYRELFLNNVVGTQNLLNLANKLPKLSKICMVSSIAVLGLDVDHLSETELPYSDQFNDAYSQTKYESEKVFREFDFKNNIQKIIVRPGIIVGDSKTGYKEKIDGPYYFIDSFRRFSYLIKKVKYLPLPVDLNTSLPIIPVDHCAKRVVQLVEFNTNEKMICAHLISDSTPLIKDLLDDLKQNLSLNVTFVPISSFTGLDYFLNLLKIPKELIFFMFSKKSYDNHFIKKNDLDVCHSDYQDYKTSLFK